MFFRCIATIFILLILDFFPIHPGNPLTSNEISENRCSPSSNFIFHHPRYSLSYDARNKVPYWVYQHLTIDDLFGEAKRSICSFKEDRRIPQYLRSTLADYRNSSFDRGHLCPSADQKWSQDAMKETYFLSNICPQTPELNRGLWVKLENYIRNLAYRYREVDVVTGPLYLPYNEGGRRYIKYEVIGINDVAVPTHFFKVVFFNDTHRNKVIEAYIIPNKPISSTNDRLDDFRVSIDKVEKLAGIIFHGRSQE